ncbi:hypothetical protein UlMin_027303 [Ulmus minor]
MTIPQRYSPKGDKGLPHNAVCKVNKSLYGLKQASRQWYAKFLASNNELVVQSLKSSLDAKFMLKDLGPLRFFLGLEVARTGRGISVSQRPYVLQILADTGYLGCKPTATPMEVNLKLNQDDGELFSYISLYRRLIGKLLYLIITRHDLSYVVNKLS